MSESKTESHHTRVRDQDQDHEFEVSRPRPDSSTTTLLIMHKIDLKPMIISIEAGYPIVFDHRDFIPYAMWIVWTHCDVSSYDITSTVIEVEVICD